MKGDYDRYIAENVDGDTKKKYADLGLAAYNASKLLKLQSQLTIRIQLNLALL